MWGGLSAGISGEVLAISGTGFAWSPGGIRGRTGEALSSRDPRGGEEVEASDAIDPKPPLAFRSAAPEPVPGMFSRASQLNLVSRTSKICTRGPANSYHSAVASKTRHKTVFSGIQPTGIPHVSHLGVRATLRASQSFS